MVTEPDDDRGQLLLIGAIAVAVVVVGSVVLLNGMKYTDTVGTSGTDDAIDESKRTVEMIEVDLKGMAGRVREDTSLRTFGPALRENVSVLSRQYTAMIGDQRSAYLNLSVNESASGNGLLLNQSISDLFEGEGRSNQWEATTGANITDPFNLTVDKWPTATGLGGSSQDVGLYMNVTDGDGNLWSLKLNDSREGPSNHVKQITIYDETGVRQAYQDDIDSWFADSGPYVIDVRNGRVTTPAGSESGLWTFAAGIEEPYNITFNNEFPGSSPNRRAEGTYRIAVDSTTTEADDNVTTKISVFHPAFDIYYHQPEISYTQTITIPHQPAEGDE